MDYQRNSMPISYLATKNALYYPNKIYAQDDSRQVTFLEFEQRTNSMARGLIEQGLERGDRVCVVDHNSVDLLEAYFGVIKAGGIMVPVNVNFAPMELEQIFADIEPKILIVGRNYLGKIESVRKDARTWEKLFLIGGGGGRKLPDFESLTRGYSPARMETIASNEDTALILLTSGTTGKPKGVMLTHRNLVTAAWTIVFHRCMGPDEIALVSAPFYNAGGLLGVFAFTLRGNTMILLNGFDPARILATIEKEKVTAIFFVPAMIVKLLQYPEIGRHDLSSLRKVGYGSAPMPVPALKQLLEKLKVEVIGIYGTTEIAGAYIAILSYEDHHLDGSPQKEKRLYSVGKEAIDACVRIFDDKDQELPPGEVGEIVHRGPSVMKGYWRKPEETAEALRNDWYHTGDLGYMDEDGYIYIVDRKKDMLISGGFNVYPKEIENVLNLHPSVLECAVIGIPHDVWGETPLAYIVLRPNVPRPTAEELMKFCEDKIARYKMPKGGIRFLDALPRNEAGKVLKGALKEL